MGRREQRKRGRYGEGVGGVLDGAIREKQDKLVYHENLPGFERGESVHLKHGRNYVISVQFLLFICIFWVLHYLSTLFRFLLFLCYF